MALAVLEKVKDYLMPIEEDNYETAEGYQEEEKENKQKPKLRLQKSQVSNNEMSVFVAYPKTFDDVQKFVDKLKESSCVIVNYAGVAIDLRKRISDFLNGACYIMGGSVSSISQDVYIYTVKSLTVEKKAYNLSSITDKYFLRNR